MITNSDSLFVPRAPFVGVMSVSAGADVLISARDGLGIATLLVRKDRGLMLARRMREEFSVELPSGPCRKVAGPIALAGTGPGAWLATCEQGGNEFVRSLAISMGDAASVSDQSDGYAVLRVSGLKARETLCKLIPIDVHARAFKAGDVATTVAAHLGVTLWRLEDAADGSPVFEITVFRSVAQSFSHLLSESAAEFGLCVSGASD